MGGKSHRLAIRLAGERLSGNKGRPFYTGTSARSYIEEKLEARNAKYETKFKNKIQMIKTVLNIGIYDFEIVSNFKGT